MACRRLRRLARVALLVIVAVNCRSSSEEASGAAGSATSPTAALSCSRIAEHLTATIIADTDKPGIQFIKPEVGPQLLRVVTRRCEEDHWSEAAKDCFLTLTSGVSTSACEAKLTGEQLAKLKTDTEIEYLAHHPQDAAAVSGEAAQATADAERVLLTQEAPGRVSVSASGCRCSAGQTIIVSCRIQNKAQVPVEVSLAAASQTGTMGHDARGNSSTPLSVDPGDDVVAEVTTYFSAGSDCWSCTNSECKASVTVR